MYIILFMNSTKYKLNSNISHFFTKWLGNTSETYIGNIFSFWGWKNFLDFLGFVLFWHKLCISNCTFIGFPKFSNYFSYFGSNSMLIVAYLSTSFFSINSILMVIKIFSVFYLKCIFSQCPTFIHNMSHRMNMNKSQG